MSWAEGRCGRTHQSGVFSKVGRVDRSGRGRGRKKEEWKNKKLTWRGRNEDVGSVVESRDGMG